MHFAQHLDLHSMGFWIGGIGSSNPHQLTPLHFDDQENLMCVMRGKKRFTIFDPTLSNYLYPIWTNSLYASGVNISVFDDIKTPLYTKEIAEKAIHVDLEPGDVFFCPAWWWHQVETTGEANMAVNFFFYPHSLLLHSHYAGVRKTLPSSQ